MSGEQELIERLKHKLLKIKETDSSMDESNWAMQEGVLITGYEALLMLNILNERERERNPVISSPTYVCKYCGCTMYGKQEEEENCPSNPRNIKPHENNAEST